VKIGLPTVTGERKNCPARFAAVVTERKSGDFIVRIVHIVRSFVFQRAVADD
jgi:hypothetical protein